MNPITVESESQQERILARRQRIQQRIDQIKQRSPKKNANKNNNKNNNDDPSSNAVQTATNQYNLPANQICVNQAEKVIETSTKSLEDFISQGQSTLSDIKIASMNHESNRRTDREKSKKEMLDRLDHEAELENLKFEDISEKWKAEYHQDVKNPNQLYQLLNTQNAKCKSVIADKNRIINLLKEAARTSEDKYMKDLKRQNDDIELVNKRMESHVKDLNARFTESLANIQGSLLDDRNSTLSNSLKKSEDSWQARALREIEMVYLRLEETDHYMKELDEIRERGAEEYSIMRNKLEHDVMTHEQQLQQMKAVYQLNQEKLQYNHEILRNREDENNIIKAQQKRRITKLQDSLNAQRQKLVKQEEQHQNEASQLNDDYLRIVNLTKELEAKMRHFENSDNKRFHEIWKMNFNTVKQLASECLIADRIIHQQQLGVNWDKENSRLWFVNNGGEDIENHQLSLSGNSANSAASVLAEEPVLAPWQADSIKKTVSITKAVENETTQSNSTPEPTTTLNEVVISDQESLVQNISKNSKLSQATIRNLLPILAEEGEFLFEKKLSTLLAKLENSHSTLIKLDAIFNALKITTEEDIAILINYLKDRIGNDLDVNRVIPALKSYISLLKGQANSSNDGSSSSSSNKEKIVSNRKSSLIGNEWAALESKYWSEMQNVIDSRKIHLWDALDNGLSKYNDHLSERRNLILETDSLKRKNNELRMLLSQYLGSKINKELQIPPTKILQGDAGLN